MSEQPSTPLAQRAAIVCAVMAAAAVPLRAFGVALEQAALGLSLIAALAVLALDTQARQTLREGLASPTAKGALTVMVAFAITVPFSHAPLGSAEIGGRTGLFVLAVGLVWAVLRTHEHVHRLLLKALMVCAYVFAVYALLSFFTGPRLSWLARGEFRLVLDPGVVFVNPASVFKAFATAAMCLLPVVAWAGRRLSGAWRWWGYAFAPLAIAIMVLTYNRSALAGVVAMTIAGLALLALAKRRHTTALLATALGIGGSIVAWIAAREIEEGEAVAQATGLTANATATYLPEWLLDAHRQNIWKFAFERFLDHPLVGNGIDQLNRLPGAHEVIPGMTQSAYVVPSHPHNWVLEILAETGLIGFGAVVLALGFVAWRLARNYIRTDDDADLALFVLMAGFWGSALFNFSIWAVWWQLTFLMLFAIISATRKSFTP